MSFVYVSEHSHREIHCQADDKGGWQIEEGIPPSSLAPVYLSHFILYYSLYVYLV